MWVYPTVREDGRLHFLADSNAAITKGMVALVLLYAGSLLRRGGRALLSDLVETSR